MRESLRTRRAALIRRGEATVEAAAYTALTELTKRIGEQLRASGMVAHGLPAGLWETILADTVEPAVRAAYTAATSQRVSAHPVAAAAQPVEEQHVDFLDPAERLGPSPASEAADAYMAQVRNRLAGVSDTVYDAIVAELQSGREAQTVLPSGAVKVGESIPQLAARVDVLLGDADRWRNRAVTIARTETIGANNAGARYAATSTAGTLGVDEDRVAKEWLATADDRTRDTHADADGQVVVGMDTPFIVGGSELQEPGDPDGDPEETICCRCTCLYHYPGDPDYPDDAAVTAAASASLYRTHPSALHTDAVIAAAEEGDGIDAMPGEDDRSEASTCTCCGGVGEHLCGHECYVCDASGLLDEQASYTDPGLDVGDPIICEGHHGRDDPCDDGRQGDECEHETDAVSPDAAPEGTPTVEEPMSTQTPERPANSVDTEPHTSVIIVALPAADDPANSIGAETKHSTLLYLGDVPDSDGDTPNALLTPEFQTALTAAVTQAASMSQPFTEDVDRIDSLGDDGARVWILKDGDLAAIRNAVIAADPTVQPALDGVTQFPDFTPHVTIDYPADAPADAETVTDDDAPDADDSAPGAPVDTTLLDPAVETAAAGITSITFDRLGIWWAGAQTEYPLTAEGDTPVHQDGAVAAAALTARVAGKSYDEIAALLGYSSAAAARKAVTAAAGDAAPVITADMEPGDPAPAMDPMAEEESESDQFYGVAVVEDSQTGDGRVFGPQSIIWDSTPLPMPLGWQVADAPGHDGSVVCGRIDAVVRFGNLIGYTGTWDVEGYGWETRRLVEGRFLRGLSVDTDDFDAIVVDSAGNVLDPMAMMFGDDEDAVLLVQKARLRSAAMCRVPAFTEAFVANGPPPAGWVGERPVDAAPTTPDDAVPAPDVPAPAVAAAALVAAAVRADLPALTLPPLADFSDPGLTEDTRLTVTDDGRVFGHLAAWGTCHIGVEGYCQEPPVSDTNYAYFLTGAVKTAGGLVAVGQLTMDTGHPALSLSASQAIAHYDNTGAVIADVAVGNDGIGIWFSGRVRPGTTPEQVYALRASGSVSGDWRPIGTCAELVAALIVNTPGFPIPAPAVAASAAGMAMVASGIVRPPVAAPAAPGALPSAGEFTAAVAASLALLGRRDAAAARVRDRRRTNSAGRYADRMRQTRVTAAAARLNRKA